MLARLSQLSQDVRERKVLRGFAWFCRVIITLAFTPAAIKKVLNMPFTQIKPEESLIGYFFDALYKTGAYYHFIGWGQLIAVVLMFVRPTRLIGALMFLAIISNILVLTWALDFQGTKWITLLMTLACLYLVAFDFDRVASLFVLKNERSVGTD